MGKIYSPSPLTSTNGFLGPLNNNLYDIETALDKCLSREGELPNQMEADLDMNSNDILNIGDIVLSDGVVFNPEDVLDRISSLEGEEEEEIDCCGSFTETGSFTLGKKHNHRIVLVFTDTGFERVATIPEDLPVGYYTSIVNTSDGIFYRLMLSGADEFTEDSHRSWAKIEPGMFMTAIKIAPGKIKLLEA